MKSGEQLKLEGMERATDHADRVTADWSLKAYTFLKAWISVNKDEFICEQVVKESAGIVPEPPDNRAWGSIIRQAAKTGLIYKTGFTTSKKPDNHMGYRSKWKPV